MRKFLLSAFVAAGFAGSAFAADLPSTKAAPVFAAPAFSWTGVYGGLEGGLDFPQISGPFNTARGGSAPYRDSITGGLLGGVAGYNYQFGSVVLGLEGNVDGVIGGKHTVGAIDGAGNPYSVAASTTYNADIRGRVGVALDRSLLYVAGGVAFGNANTTYSSPALTSQASFNSPRAGWTVGFGWDYAFTNNIIGRVEYRYTDLGRASSVSAPNAFSDSTHLEASSVLLGVIYKFGAPAPVAAKY
jgi:outer membrane immunogenic protein